MTPNPTSQDGSLKEVCLELSKYDHCDTSVAIVADVSTSCHEVVPASPMRERTMPPLATPLENAKSLESLKMKYPQFLHTLPEAPSRKRRRPVCRFVNFMGRRGAPPAKQSKSILKSVVLNPTDSPLSSNLKREQTSSSSLEAEAGAGAETSTISKRKHIELDPTPHPTDAPTRAAMTSYDSTTRPHKQTNDNIVADSRSFVIK